MEHYQICKRCIMDTTDPEIQFDENGICNHCRGYDQLAKERLFDEETNKIKLQQIVDEMKAVGKGNKYDCIIGVSGGVDSTYVAYKVKELGLRPLAVHFDNGWNSELAVSNIEKTLNKLDIDLYTYVMDWDEFKDLQVSFLKASVPDLEIPSDHAIVATLYRVAAREGVHYILQGANIRTEGIMPRQWSHGHGDWKYIKNIQKQFGNCNLKKFPYFSLAELVYYMFVRKIRGVGILDYLSFSKQEAMQVLEGKLGWRPYGGKHYESLYTRFIQGYVLPVKFNFDKRRAHLSTLICSGQITRESALSEMEQSPCTDEQYREDRELIMNKFDLTENAFERLMALPNKSFWDYPSYEQHWAYVFGYNTLRSIYRRFFK